MNWIEPMRRSGAGVVLLLAASVAVAAQTNEESGTNRSLTAAGGMGTNAVDRGHRRASNFVLDAGDRLDAFLHDSITGAEGWPSPLIQQFYGDRRLRRDMSSGSYITITPEFTFSESGGLSADVDFSVRLKLHRLSDRLEFFVERFEDEDDLLDQVMGRVNRRLLGERTDEGGAGLRYRLPDYFSLKPSVSAGVAFKPAPVLRLKTRARLTFKMRRWTSRLTESFIWESDDGFGERTQLQFIRPIGDSTEFRSSTAAVWSETSQGVDFGHAFVLAHVLSHRRSIAARLGASGHTEPSTVMDDYTAHVTWRQRVYRNWLFLEIEPGVDFPDDRNFQATPLLSIRFDIIFGAVREDS